MVASIAGALPGSTVVRRAETPTNRRDGRSGDREARYSAEDEDRHPGEDNQAERRGGGFTSAPPGGLTVEGLLALQQQPDEDGTADLVPAWLPKSPY